MIINRFFQNLRIIWTPGSNLVFPDTLSRNVAVEEYQKHKLQHRKTPRDIEFYDEHGSPVTYRIQHDDNPKDTCNDFYPIHCQHRQNISTILVEQIKDPVLGTVRSWLRKGISPDSKSPDIQQSKGLLRYCQEFDRLLIEEEGQLLCYNEHTDKLDNENQRICLPLSLSLACFRLEHYNEMGGHMGASKTYNNAKRFYYWPGMFDWICALTADCLTCQNNKPKPKHRNEVPLEEWQNETVLF